MHQGMRGCSEFRTDTLSALHALVLARESVSPLCCLSYTFSYIFFYRVRKTPTGGKASTPNRQQCYSTVSRDKIQSKVNFCAIFVSFIRSVLYLEWIGIVFRYLKKIMVKLFDRSEIKTYLKWRVSPEGLTADVCSYWLDTYKYDTEQVN